MGYQEEARRILFEYLRRMENKENITFALLASRWKGISEDLKQEINRLAAIAEKSEYQMFQIANLQTFLAQAESKIDTYNQYALGLMEPQEIQFAKLGFQSASKMLSIGTGFGKLNPKVIELFILKTQENSPLQQLLRKSYGQMSQQMIQTITNGLARGMNPVKVARELVKQVDIPLSRAITITRTECLNAYRESSIYTFKQSNLCEGWERVEAEDCCDECAIENHSKHDLDEPFDTHPRCRGAAIPVLL